MYLQIMGFVINRSLVKLIQQVIDEDGSVKDSAVFLLFILYMDLMVEKSIWIFVPFVLNCMLSSFFFW